MKRQNRTGRKPQAIDLFAGCGGLTLGLKQAGFRVVGAVEIDPLAVRTYKSNHKGVSVTQADIRSISASAMGKKLGLPSGSLDLLAGCPPCQGFSTLRTNNGAVRNRDRRNDLVREMLRFARALRPRAIMMENVPGLAGYAPFKRLCKQLGRMGYRVSFGVKDAARFGVPQRRKRLILLAGRGFDIPFAEESDVMCTVRDAIGKMPDAGRTHDALHNLPEKRSDKVQELIRDIPKDGGSRRDLPRSRQLKCHRKSNGFGDIYGRMDGTALPRP